MKASSMKNRTSVNSNIREISPRRPDKSSDQRDRDRLAIIEPIELLKRCQSQRIKDQNSSTEALYDRISEAYAAATAIRGNKNAIKQLLADKFWNDRTKRPKESDLERRCLLHCLVFGLNAKSKKRYDRAQKYSRALAPFFEKNEPASKVRQILGKHGINKLIKGKDSTKSKKHDLRPDRTPVTIELSGKGWKQISHAKTNVVIKFVRQSKGDQIEGVFRRRRKADNNEDW